MRCPNCGKTGFVAVGSERFCSNCGTKLAAGAGRPAAMTDISTTKQPLDLRALQPASTAPSGSTAGAATTAAAAKSAAQLHGRQSASGVLDLRTQAAGATPGPATAPAPSPTPPAPSTPAAIVAPGVNEAAPAQPVPGQVITASVVAAATVNAASDIAAATKSTKPATPATLSPAKMVTPAPPVVPPQAPTPQPATPAVPTASAIAPTSTPAQPTAPQSAMIKKFHGQPKPATVDAAAAVAAAQVDALSAQAANAPTPPLPPPQSPALQQALAAAKQSSSTAAMVKITAAIVGLGLMAGVVWMQNSPKLAFHEAASKASINATLPTYIPSSYHQSGSIVTGVGELVQKFVSPGANTMSIRQRQTNWDSGSLRDNYVSQQADNFLAVQGQGLTIYLFNGEADWVNHGVWYQLNGVDKLSRDQILRIAYGL